MSPSSCRPGESRVQKFLILYICLGLPSACRPSFRLVQGPEDSQDLNAVLCLPPHVDQMIPGPSSFSFIKSVLVNHHLGESRAQKILRTLRLPYVSLIVQTMRVQGPAVSHSLGLPWSPFSMLADHHLGESRAQKILRTLRLSYVSLIMQTRGVQGPTVSHSLSLSWSPFSRLTIN
jgi:hypothetical protein